MPGHNFIAHVKVTIIKQVNNKSLLNSKIHSLLEHRKDFWILKLQFLSSQGLKLSLNYPEGTTGSIYEPYPHFLLFISFFIETLTRGWVKQSLF